MFEELEDLHCYRWNGEKFVSCRLEDEGSFTWYKERNLMMKNERFEFEHLMTLRQKFFGF